MIQPTTSVSKRRILVPLANIVAVPQLARAAAKLADAIDAEIHLLHVVDVPMLTRLEDAQPRRREAERLFEIAHANLPAHLRPRTEVRLGHLVGAQIRRSAIEAKADVMLVGWRRDFTLKSLVAGTLRPVLARPPCDVLILDLDREDALDHVVELPTGERQELGLRVVAAAARAHATGVLIAETSSRAPADAKRRRTQLETIVGRLRGWAPQVAVNVVVERAVVPLHRLVERAGQVFLVLVSPAEGAAPRVRPLATRARSPPFVIIL